MIRAGHHRPAMSPSETASTSAADPTAGPEVRARPGSPVQSGRGTPGPDGAAPRVPVGPGPSTHQVRATDFYPVTDPPMRVSKVQPPPLREEVLSRARLLDWLDAKIHRRVVAIVAEAGYGKTTLLADWTRRTRMRVVWHRLDEDDRDIVVFIRYLLAACRSVAPDMGETTAGLLRDIGTLATTAETLADTFIRELGGMTDQPTVLIFDDVHAIERAPEVQRALREIVARAPDRMSIVLSGRRRPPVPLARVRTHGELAELVADDLRFDHAETESLFRDAYHHPLDRESLATLEKRTHGWAASLDLVRAAIRDRSDADTRRFIRDLSAAEGPLYEYLAEEVVSDLEPALQAFLMRSALLVDVEIEPAMVAAEVDHSQAQEFILEAERLGLLSVGRGRGGRSGAQYHPLVREFLTSRLEREIGTESVRAIHRRIAVAAEPTNWRRAAHHFAEAGDVADLQRVLVQATRSIMASGDYSYAESYITRFPSNEESPWFDIILSRRELRGGRVTEAIERAERAAAALKEAGPDRHLALANLMTVLWYAGDLDRARELALEVSEMRDEPALVPIAIGMLGIIDASRGGSITLLAERLSTALAMQTEGGERHYRAVTLLNLSVVYRLQVQPERALDCADEALAEFGDSAAYVERSSAHLARAWALAHLNRLSEADSELRAARDLVSGSILDEVMSEGGDILGTYFDPTQAAAWMELGADPDVARWAHGPSMLRVVQAENEIRLGHVEKAAVLLDLVDPVGASMDLGLVSRRAGAAALIALRRGRADAPELSRLAMATARSQGAELWAVKAELTAAAAEGDPTLLSRTVLTTSQSDTALLTAFAETYAYSLHLLSEDALEAVAAAAVSRPARWRGTLRVAIGEAGTEATLAAVRLLETIGTSDDVALLREAGRRIRRQRDVDVHVRRLARRVAAPVTVHDLGAVSVSVGGVQISGSSVRRKVLSLLCYLCTRTDMAATREQVLEAIWPDLTPELASNSLNQTVYFLRRVFEPDYRDDTSPGYVMSDQDMVWMDRELVRSDSQTCASLLRRVALPGAEESLLGLAGAYRGRFALDFEYEDWATAYRDHLHARYLEAMERAILRHSQEGEYEHAIYLAQRVLEVDPSADNVERTVIRLYRSMGAFAAAAEQYAHYAQVQRAELGVEAPPIDSL